MTRTIIRSVAAASGLSLVLLAGCASSGSTSQPASQPTTRAAASTQSARASSGLAARVARTHGESRWDARPALQADIAIDFGGGRILDGTMLFDTAVGRVRMELNNGNVLVFDGERAWMATPMPRARFHLLTWPYFLAAPFKLDDGGANLRPTGSVPLTDDGPAYDTARLTFDVGVGDAPDDWYELYVDDAGRLAAMGYIVTYGGTDPEAAEDESHAITYDRFVNVDGVALSDRWTFWNWTREDGLTGAPIGAAVLSDLRFVTPAPDAFTKPAGATEDPLPSG